MCGCYDAVVCLFFRMICLIFCLRVVNILTCLKICILVTSIKPGHSFGMNSMTSALIPLLITHAKSLCSKCVVIVMRMRTRFVYM